ncbi:MAG: universal stress protein [Gemmatimonadetes bacterium]|jgi:nucleotide-binding universal stress UspA family protein|nr:universal stress protein [Gemmatimonadota bacterium]MBT5055250.1 universal stress protein [Gemmatimonadota bacterium]MBT5144712.1 universal stress protein [Gemmatimonadota bacterium]MBT5589571.1 universal stress protein [Gemmatimonadota bacterium]MBT5963323.1 universal stress protein [Gemmatimonadota bacterium]
MKKILVAVDFSDASASAVRQALVLATALDADLLLLHVLHVPAEAPGFYSSRKLGKKLFRNMEEAANGMMAEFLAKHVKKAKKTPQTKILPGIPGDEIVRQARKEKADLVVIGTRGHSGFKRFLLGSVADHVIRACHCPVLSLRDES